MTSTGPWAVAPVPREWQVNAVAAWEQSGRHGIVGVVTGAGKTLFAEMCMTAYRNSSPNGLIFILVPTLALLDQWYVSLREDLDLEDADIGTFSGEGHSPSWRAINLVVLNTSRTIYERIPADESMLVVDECHRAATSENSKALSANYAATLGMSATPERDYDAGMEELLIPALGPVVFVYDYNAAVRDGVVAPFDLVNIEVEMRPKERDAYDRFTRRVAVALGRLRAGEEVESTLRRLLQQRAAVAAQASLRIPLAVRLVEDNRGARTLVFHERIPAAQEIYMSLRARGASATIYHSGIDGVVRRDNLRLFRRGVFDVLVTCRALDEGVNVPETRVAVLASSTASTRQRIQRLGRVLRPAPGKASATVYTIYASEPERRRLASEASELVGARSVAWQRASVAGG